MVGREKIVVLLFGVLFIDKESGVEWRIYYSKESKGSK